MVMATAKLLSPASLRKPLLSMGVSVQILGVAPDMYTQGLHGNPRDWQSCNQLVWSPFVPFPKRNQLVINLFERVTYAKHKRNQYLQGRPADAFSRNDVQSELLDSSGHWLRCFLFVGARARLWTLLWSTLSLSTRCPSYLSRKSLVLANIRFAMQWETGSPFQAP